MAALHEDDAWRLAMAAAEVLRGRVWLVEARKDIATLESHYSWVNIDIHDPKSYAFAQLQRQLSSSSVAATTDCTTYAQTTRAAMDLWAAIARCPGYSARDNDVFWLRVLREVTPASQTHVSNTPKLFDARRDLHEPSDAFGWVNAFMTAFFSQTTDTAAESIQNSVAKLASLCTMREKDQRVSLQLFFQVPVMRVHGPMGSSLVQHRDYLQNAHDLVQELTVHVPRNSISPYELLRCKAAPRGSLRPSDFVAIGSFFDQSSPLHVSELCVEIANEPSLDGFAQALKQAYVKSLTVNVANAEVSVIAQLAHLLASTPTIKTLRLFNAFQGTASERRDKWHHLHHGLRNSSVLCLELERAHLEVNDLDLLRGATNSSNGLRSLILKPVVSASVPTLEYLELIKIYGSTLQHVDASLICLESTHIDELIGVCPSLTALRVGTVGNISNTKLLELMRQRVCQLSSLSISCPLEETRELIDALANQPIGVALSLSHLKELAIAVDALDQATTDGLVRMLQTNHSLQFCQVKQRSPSGVTPEDAWFTLLHRSQVVRKLPMVHKASFLSVLQSTSSRTLSRFDTGVASEILAFAGHSVSRSFHLA